MNLAKTVAYMTLDAVTLGRGVRRTVDGREIRFPAKWSRYYGSVYEPETSRFLSENVQPGPRY